MESLDNLDGNIKSEMDYEDEPMDTNESPFDEFFEDGEINTSEDEKNVTFQAQPILPSIYGKTEKDSTASDVNIFDKDEISKKVDRAKRFSVPVIKNVLELDKEMSILFRDLGIYKENKRYYRFNAIHMRGTENMSTEDVFKYFESLAPSHIEWINDVSCNVVWMDNVSAAKVLLSMSRKIRNLNKVHLNADPFEKEFKETDSDSDSEELNDEDSVDAREIKAAIPPGFWRIGAPAEKSEIILLRYATRSDKKQKNAERNSEYYKKYGNPHYGNITGLLSKSLRTGKKKLKYKPSDSNSRWETKNNKSELQLFNKKNPWEDLAHEWGKSDKVEDDNYGYVRSRVTQRSRSPALKSDIPDLKISSRNKKANRKRFYVDRTYETSPNSSDRETWETRTKVPRMKMYADDEEKRLEKCFERRLQSGKFVKKPVEDLRSKINRKKSRPRFKFRLEKKKAESSNSESDNSENEFDADSGDWALEEYHDLRNSLGKNKKKEVKRFSARKYQSESEDNGDDLDDENDNTATNSYRGNFGHRSPLQIEIDNDEYFQHN